MSPLWRSLTKSLTVAVALAAGIFGTAAQADAASFSFTATDTPIGIPDLATINSNITVTTASFPVGSRVQDMNVTVTITHTFDQDLIISLRHVDTGTTVSLFNRRGGSGDNLTNVTFNDAAAVSISTFIAPGTNTSYRPESVLSAFNGESLLGTWRLIVQDAAAADVGTLSSFNINGIATPEPGTWALFGVGGLALLVVVRRRRRAYRALSASASRGDGGCAAT